MKKFVALDPLTRRLIVLAVFATALAVALIGARPLPAYADDVVVPPVPANIQAPAGTKAFLEGHAVGTQDYICLPSSSGFAWTFLRPQATLFNDKDEQITTHFLSPNPSEGGVARATWQHSRDTSTVWAAAIASSSDPAYVAPNSIPWLLLEEVNTQAGPDGGDKLTKTTYIQRLNTTGGIAPTSGCATAADVGTRAFVPYTADYFFYR